MLVTLPDIWATMSMVIPSFTERVISIRHGRERSIILFRSHGVLLRFMTLSTAVGGSAGGLGPVSSRDITGDLGLASSPRAGGTVGVGGDGGGLIGEEPIGEGLIGEGRIGEGIIGEAPIGKAPIIGTPISAGRSTSITPLPAGLAARDPVQWDRDYNPDRIPTPREITWHGIPRWAGIQDLAKDQEASGIEGRHNGTEFLQHVQTTSMPAVTEMCIEEQIKAGK